MQKLAPHLLAFLLLFSLACTSTEIGNFFAGKQPTPEPRMVALIIGTLEQVGNCLRVRLAGESSLLVFPADFQVSVANNQVTITDLPFNKTRAFPLGAQVEFGGGEVPQLPNRLLARVPGGCLGPYWVFGGWVE